jgi:hypothetical protein
VTEFLELRVWGSIFDSIGVQQFLSVERARILDQQLEGKGDPLGPITLDNVMGMLRGLHGSLETMAAEAVAEVYEFLRPPRSKLKTNGFWKVGKRVVLERCCSMQWTYRLSSDTARNQIGALDRVFHLLDGAGYVSRTYLGELGDAINAVPVESPVGRTKYFAFKLFRNGNIHLEFLRPDLVDKLNQIAGGKRLRAGSVAA